MSLDQLRLDGKRVLVRVDFNVPLDDSLAITDDKRIQAAIPTIRKIMESKGSAILISHLGRPDGKKVAALSLKPCADRLSELLKHEVAFCGASIGDEAQQAVQSLKPGQVILMENLRFHSQETDNDDDFSRQLAELGDVYVNDAFGTAHRAHASTQGVTKYFQSCAAGYLMTKELEYLGKALESPQRPFVAVIGGAKISGKIDVIENLLERVDQVLIGGGMMYTFAKALGYDVGKSLLEADKLPLANRLIEQGGHKLVLPKDTVIADKFESDASTRIVDLSHMESDWIGVDIGLATRETYSAIIRKARTILWNGPMGVFEIEAFAAGTITVAQEIADATDRGAVSIVGGGDSAAALKTLGLEHRVSHVSTGGGASLEFLEGRKLPGVEALTEVEHET